MHGRYAAEGVPVVLGGDWNIQVSDWHCAKSTSHASWLHQLIDSLSWANLNVLHQPGVPTRVLVRQPAPDQDRAGALPSPVTSASIIDWAFASSPAAVDGMQIGADNPFLNLSDHCTLTVSLAPRLRLSASRATDALSGSTLAPRSWRIPRPESQRYHTLGMEYRYVLARRIAKWLLRWPEELLHSSTCTQQQLEQAWEELMLAITESAENVYERVPTSVARPNPTYFFHDERVAAAYKAAQKAESNYRRSPTGLHAKARADARRRRDCITRQVRREYWQDFQDKLEDDQQRIVWSIWHRSKGASSKSISNVKDSQGRVPSTQLESVTNLAAFYANVSDVRSVPCEDPRLDEIVTRAIGDNQFRSPAGFGASRDGADHANFNANEALWTQRELKQACKHIPLN
ncbi:MAG: hypothetical protein ACRER5_09125, partial [Pseudomonas sp.]